MPISKVADRATVNGNAAVTTADFVLTGMTVGNILIIRTSADNSGGGGVARTITVTNQSGTPIDTATDQAYQRNNDPGSASAGVTCNVIVAEITATSGTVRITYSGSVVQAGVAEEWTGIDHATALGVIGTPVGNDGVASTNLASLTDSSIAPGNMAYAAMAVEGPASDTYTQDSDTTRGTWSSLTKAGTSNATATDNQTTYGGYKIVDAVGGQTYNPTINNARDSAGIILEFKTADATPAPPTVATTSTVGTPTIPQQLPIEPTGLESSQAQVVPFTDTPGKYLASWPINTGVSSDRRRFRLYSTSQGDTWAGPTGAALGTSASLGTGDDPGMCWRQSPTQVGYFTTRSPSGIPDTIYSGVCAYDSGSDSISVSGDGQGSNTLQPVIADGGGNSAFAARMTDSKSIIVADQNTDATNFQVRAKALTVASGSATSFTIGTVLNIAHTGTGIAATAGIFALKCVGMSDTRAVILAGGTDGSTTAKVYGQLVTCTSGSGTTLATSGSWTALNDDFLYAYNNDQYFECIQIDSTRFLLAWAGSTDSTKADAYLKARIIDITGDTFTLGTVLTLESIATSVSSTHWQLLDHTALLTDNKVFISGYRSSAIGNPTYGTIASNTVVAGNSMNITKPTSTADGDLLHAFFSIDGDTGSVTITPPAGWTEHTTSINSGNVGLRSFYKQASSEGASYTWGFSSNVTAVGAIVRVTGATVDVEAPWTTASTGSGNNPDTADNIIGQVALAVSGTDTDVAHTAPSGYTEVLDLGAGATVRLSIAQDSNIGTGPIGAAFTAASTNWATLHVPSPSWNSAMCGWIVDVGASGTTATLDTGRTKLLTHGSRTDSNYYQGPSYLATDSSNTKIIRAGQVFTSNGPAIPNRLYESFGFIDLPGSGDATVAATTVATTSTVGAPVLQTSVTVATIATASTVSIPAPVIPVAVPVATVATRTYIQSGSYLNLPGALTTSWTQVPNEAALQYTGSDLEFEWWGTVEDGFTHGSIVHLIANKIDTLSVNTGGFYWSITTTGLVRFLWGTGSTNLSALSTTALQNVVETKNRFGLKTTWVRNNGGGVWECQHYYNKGDGWVSLGGQVGSVLGVIGAVNWVFRMGADIYGNNGPHHLHQESFVARDGPGGTDILNINWAKVRGGTNSFTADTGQTVSRGSSTSIVGLVNTGSTVTTSTVATSSAVGVPVTQTSSAVTTTTVATVSTIGAPVVRAGATPVTTAVATVTAVGSPTISAGSTVTTTTVATASQVGVPVTRTAATISATTVATTSTVGVPVIPIVISVAAVATVSTVGAPTVRTGSTVTTTTVATVSQVGAPVVRTGATLTPPAIATVSTVGAPTVRTGSTVTTVSVATISQVGTIAFVAHATPLTTTVATVSAVGVPLTRTGTAPTPPTVATATSVGTPAISTGSTVTTTTVTTVTAVGTPATLVATIIPVATVATVTAINAPTIVTSVHATVNAVTVDTATTVGVPAVRLGASPAPSTVVTVSTVGAPAVQTGVTPAPPAVATASSVGTPTISAGATVTTTTVATVSQVDAVAFTAPATVATVSVQTVTAIGAPAFVSAATVAATTVATTTTVGALVQTGATPAPTTVATVTTINAPVVSTAAAITTVTVATSSQVHTPAVSTGASIAAQTVATVSTIAAPAVQTQGNVNVATVTVATTTTIGTATFSTGAGPLPVTVATITSIGAPALSTGATPTPVTVATVTSISAPVVSTGAQPTPASVPTVTAVGVPTISAGATVTTSTVATNSSIGTVAVTLSATVAVQTVTTSSTVGAPVIATQGNVTVTPPTVSTSSQIGAPTTQTSSTVAAQTVATTTTIAAPVIDTATRPTPATVETTTTIGAPAITRTATVVPQTIPTVTAIGSALVTSPNLVPVSTVSTTTQVGVLVISSSAAAVVTTIGTTTQVLPVSISAGATALVEAIQTQSQVGFVVVRTGLVVTLPVVLQVTIESRSVTASIQPRSLTTNMADRVPAPAVNERSQSSTVTEQTVSTDFDEGLTIRRPDE